MACAPANWSCRFVDPDCLRQSERRKRHDALVRKDSGVGIATEIGGLHLVGAALQIATDGRASGLLVQTSPTHCFRGPWSKLSSSQTSFVPMPLRSPNRNCADSHFAAPTV